MNISFRQIKPQTTYTHKTEKQTKKKKKKQVQIILVKAFKEGIYLYDEAIYIFPKGLNVQEVQQFRIRYITRKKKRQRISRKIL